MSNTPYAFDGRIIRRYLDTKTLAVLVVERKRPDHIMVIKAYAKSENGSGDQLNRNRVVCAIFGNEREQDEFDIDDMMIYRSL